MRRIREVLRLSAIVGENISAIARGGKLARSTVRDYLDRAKAGKPTYEAEGSWPWEESFFPKPALAQAAE